MSTGGQDLFVVCKSCGSEVSPYITECPYCGNRLRKRAPKLDRDQRVAEPRLKRQPPALLTRLRRDEIPGIRGERHPHATTVLVAAGMAGCLLWKTALDTNLPIIGEPRTQWWRLLTAAFTYDNVGYAFVCLTAVALFGWLLERRHGSLTVLLIFFVGAVGGLAAATVLSPASVLMGGLGGALALLCAWVVPDLLTLRRGGEVEGDMIGTAAIAGALLLMPLAAVEAAWVADAVGVVVGLAIGLPLALRGPR